MNSTLKTKIILLAAVVFISAVAGTWLLLSPTIEQQHNLAQQNALLAALEAAPMMTASPAPAVTPGPAAEPEISADASSPTDSLTPTPAPSQDPLVGIGILAIDKIDLKLPVVEGVTLDQLKVAVGHVPQTPAIGAIGNAVIAGHRNYSYGSMFNRLGEISVGDIITYTPKGGQPMQFKVFEITEIEPGDQIAFIQPKDESIITLYTCTPVRVATQRLLIRAQLVD